jgi:hypothetical protein
MKRSKKKSFEVKFVQYLLVCMYEINYFHFKKCNIKKLEKMNYPVQIGDFSEVKIYSQSSR